MLKLLIVEDNQAMRNLIKSIIEDMADRITECDDGAAALDAYRQCRPDWVLMDIKMPGLDGISATGRITAAFPEARVIIVTDHNDERLRRAARAAGACHYLLKENLLELPNILSVRQQGAAH